MSEQNKALVRRAVERIWNDADYAVLDQFVSEDFHIHGGAPGTEIHGREGTAQYFAALRSAFPDLRFSIDDQIAEGDRVVTRWSASGTHLGNFFGIPPSGKRVTIEGTDIDRIANGLVVECWPRVDELWLLQQLGAIPAPQTAPAGQVAE
ncbi:MAG TPA: ester cyclase [Thermomicrobiales bacterium]|nr:ester cyclase [Thermomicrobiales bacterium]